MCVYICVYIYICMCIYPYVCVCAYIYVYVCIYICIRICICSSFSMCNSFRFIANFSRKLSFRMCVCVCVYICMCVCVCTYMCWHTGISLFEAENWLTIYWACPALKSKSQFPPQPVPPIRKLPQASYPHPSEGRENENHNHRKLTKLITWSQPCPTQWNYELSCVGPHKTDGSWWRVWTKHGQLEKEMAKHFSILSWEPHEQYEKTKRYDTERWIPQVSRCSICYWRRAEKQIKKEKESEPKGKQTQLWMCLVVRVKSNAIKNNIA